MRMTLFTVALFFVGALQASADDCQFTGTAGDFHGYASVDFEIEGRLCRVVCPKETAPGKPWLWRARYWDNEPQTDVALLGKGFHVAYTDVEGLFGNDVAVKAWDVFYTALTEKHGFNKKPAIMAISRGGLIAYNFTSKYPERIACIYADAPVCDIKSWPGGFGEGTGNSNEWQPCLDAYGLDEKTVLEFKGNPIDKLAPIAKAKIPLLHICGTADKGVPMDENTGVLAERYRALGGDITIIAKEGVGHHPHSLEDPTPIVDFILKHTEANAELSGKEGDYYGFRTVDFEVNGRHCRVAIPKHTAPGKPWVWRARFWGHEPQTDIAMLGEGFHVAYTDVGALFGNDEAVEQFNQFHAYLTKEHGFAPKAALEAMSRGGLIAYNFASAYPEKVACIYGDAPVCDIKSWPGGLGEGKGSKADWEKCLVAHGVDEESVLAYKGNPIDKLGPIAAAKIPLLNICGDADDVVPMKENTDILAERYRDLGGEIEVIAKAGVGHHPHSLKDPKIIVDFMLQHADPFARDYFALRRGLTNAGATFTQTKKGRVAFLGGSITEMQGWRELTCAELERRFPETEFDFVHAGISSTDSTLGAFRLTTDVFGRGPVDLLFMDHSVNDHHNNRSSDVRIRAVEGIIRHAHSLNPNIDIIQQYFVEPYNMEFIERGEVAPEIADHNRVTDYLNIPAIDLAREVTERIRKGDFTWEQFKDLHPSPFGHEIYAGRIAKLFDAAWKDVNLSTAEIGADGLNPVPLDPLNYSRGRYIALETAKLESGWNIVPAWQRSDQAGTRKQFVGVPTLEAVAAGATLTLEFEGTAVGLLVTAGPDVGILEFAIDGKAYPPLDQFTQWSDRLHIPWAYTLADDLAEGKHTLTLTTSEEKNEKSLGNAARIVKFYAN